MDIISKVVSIAIAFILLVICPFVNTVTTDSMVGDYEVINATTAFLDTVVDSGKVNKAMLASLNAEYAATGKSVRYTLYRKSLTYEPDPLKAGDYYPSYISQDDTTTYNTSDLVGIKLHVVSNGVMASLIEQLSPMYSTKLNVSFCERVR